MKSNDKDHIIESFVHRKNMAKKNASKQKEDDRLFYAQSFCDELISTYWNSIIQNYNCNWTIAPSPINPNLDENNSIIAQNMGESLVSIPINEAGYYIGSIYTALLPNETRSQLGAYYTPPALVDRLLDIVNDSGFNWKNGRVLDPACGGAAFLAPVAYRMIEKLRSDTDIDSNSILKHITKNLHGIEIDPFAVWMSNVLLEISLLDICLSANQRLPSLITLGDSLSIPIDEESFDLVIGNPPYGRVTLTKELRNKYSRSLFGHANLYGVFTDLATRLVKKNGLVAYVTPTSFLGGQYFKKLRQLLGESSPPIVIDFITERIGVFEDVLQETALVVFSDTAKKTLINTLTTNGNAQPFKVCKIGYFKLPSKKDEPWLFPRSIEQKITLGKVLAVPNRLEDYGFRVSTGPLVWNRHKDQLKDKKGPNGLPLIWAESVFSNGMFKFRAIRKNHKLFFEIKKSQQHLVIQKPCVLVQRTTAKEQHRRLIAAVLPEDFISKSEDGVVIENHLNVIRPINYNTKLSLDALAALLNSQIIDQVFRCISGSVAVSAYELNSLPFPNPNEIDELENLIKNREPHDIIEKCVAKLYGIENERKFT